MRTFKLGQATRPAPHHQTNEDALAIFDGKSLGDFDHTTVSLLLVADGLGGETCAQDASRRVIDCIARNVKTALQSSEAEILEIADPAPILRNLLQQSIQLANEDLYTTCMVTEAPNARASGGQSTIVCVLYWGTKAIISHVGDSRAYLFDGHDLIRLTRDHSVVERLISLGLLREADRRKHHLRSMLSTALGAEAHVVAELQECELHSEYRLLLCTDGLWNVLSDQEITGIIATATDPQFACEQLIEAAHNAGAEDDISVILACWDCSAE